MPYEWAKVADMENSYSEEYRILSMDINAIFFHLSFTKNCSGKRTIVYGGVGSLESHDPWGDTNKIVQDKVLGDKRSAAFAATIWDIQSGAFGYFAEGWWSECKDCDSWYKSERTVLSEARFYINKIYFYVLT